jgi:hypothetical protein
MVDTCVVEWLGLKRVKKRKSQVGRALSRCKWRVVPFMCFKSKSISRVSNNLFLKHDVFQLLKKYREE